MPAPPSLLPATNRRSSRTPSLLSILRSHEQPSSSLPSLSPDLGTRLAHMVLKSPPLSPPPPRPPSSATSHSSARRPNGRLRHRDRKHIYDAVHKAKLKEDRKTAHREMLQRAYERRQRQGYQSSFQEFEGYILYFDQVKSAIPHDPSKVVPPLDKVDDGLRRAISIARASMLEPKPIQFDASALDAIRRKYRDQDAKIEAQLRPKLPPLPTSLPPEDEAKVKALLGKRGQVSKFAREAVEDRDLIRLRPSQWLNDELINFYGAMIMGRSESCKENLPNGGDAKGRGRPLNVHYFSTFFWVKLTKEGYDKGRLAKWTKKVDIFSKDAVLVPVNHNNAHWTAAAINFRRKRIESYDSMGLAKDIIFLHLRAYLDAEHRNKKKAPFDFIDWVDYAPDDITPQQENGYDCGVFTCQFLESLSRGEEVFRFTQNDMSYLRRRMIWEIGHATLRDD